MELAIIGSGISGLVAAHRLHPHHRITIFEQNDYVGGHTHTVEIPSQNRSLAIDTGFIVFNERTYPAFSKLLRTLDVPSQPSSMSFSVRSDRSGLEYSPSSLDSLFAQRKNLLNPSFYRMLGEVVRFRSEARELLHNDDDITTLGAYLHRRRYARSFVQDFVVPMGAAIWSANPAQLLEMPAQFFVRFFQNHGILYPGGQPQWLVVKGGSQRYVDALVAPFRDRIRLREGVKMIRRGGDQAQLMLQSGEVCSFDKVIIAAHSDQALRLLADPTSLEREVLSSFPYQRNEVVLHTDTSLLPKNRKVWSSWNYHVPQAANDVVTVTYNMNILQGLEADETYCVTLNRTEAVDPKKVLQEFIYHHPIFTPRAIAAQKRHARISGHNHTYYCGAYWGYGFHEDGVQSGLAVARQLGVTT